MKKLSDFNMAATTRLKKVVKEIGRNTMGL
jgi:hypothetical protein